MKIYTGIDLGSTTTKAVVLDEDQGVLGRGVTNSRSNYAVACAAARDEALAAVRLELCRRNLADSGLGEERLGRVVAALDREWRVERFLGELAALEAYMSEDLEWVERLFPGGATAEAAPRVFEAIRAEAPSLPGVGAARGSDFFRDAAGSAWRRHAKAAAKDASTFDSLCALFDRSVLRTENREGRSDGSVEASRAVARAAEEEGLAGGADARVVRRALEDAFAIPLEDGCTVGTGYGRATLPFPKDRIRSEILCHGLGAHRMFPGTRTVLDIGGQDTKAIQTDAEGIVTSFQMNDRCAAGCGRYLGYIADEMNLGLHELGPLAAKSERPARISSTCTVFAGAEIRDRLTLGQRREDILAGLHRAVILRALSLLARSGGVRDEFTFTGGVAKNETAVRVLRDLVRAGYGDVAINVSPDSIYTGALGGAVFAWRAAHAAAEARS